MKTGKWTWVAININCPHCGQGWTSPAHGSFMICADDREFAKAGQVVKCDDCGQEFKLPQAVDKL